MSGALLVVGLLLIGIAGAAESVLSIAARSSLRTQLGGSKVRSRAVTDLLEQPFRAWLLIAVTTVVGVLLAGIAIPFLAGSTATSLVWIGLVVGSAGVLTYVASRAVAIRAVDAAALLAAAPLLGLRIALWPILVVIEWVSPVLTGNGTGDLPGALALTRGDDPRMLLEVDDEDGLLEEGEREMIVSIFELGDTKVREVMVPRIDIVAIPIAASLDEALDTILQAGHSRIPVYRESIDDIAGLLYAKDLLKAFRERDYAPDIMALLREAYYVPESKPVDELLAELQSRKVHMAVVVDEYGGTAGLVTIEDLLEEIVGEIQDEYDTEEARVELLSEDEGIFYAGMDIDDVNRLLDISLPTDDVDTLAGLVFTSLGKVPDIGDTATFPSAEIEVLAVSGRRIDRVRVVRRAPEEEDEAAIATEGNGHEPPA